MSGHHIILDEFSANSDQKLGMLSLSHMELVALVCFVGIICFCAVQAVVAPRRTFCSQKMPPHVE